MLNAVHHPGVCDLPTGPYWTQVSAKSRDTWAAPDLTSFLSTFCTIFFTHTCSPQPWASQTCVLSAWIALLSGLQVTHSFIFSMSLLRHNFLNNPSGFLPWCSACLMHKDPLHISECMGNAKPGPLVQHLSQKAAACLLLIQHMDGSYARIAYIRTVCCEWLRRVWLFANPVDCSPPGSSVHGILQARKQEQVAASFSRGSSRPRVWTQGSCVVGRAVCPFKIPLWPWVSSLNLALGRSLHLPRRGWDSQVVDFAAQKPLMPVLL